MARSSRSAARPLRLAVLGLVLLGVVWIVARAPQLFGLEATGWWVTVAVGVVMGAAVVIYGYAKRGADAPPVPAPEP